MKPTSVLALALLLSRSAGAADAKEPQKVDMTKAFRACALVEKVDVLHGGTLTDEGKENAKSCLGSESPTKTAKRLTSMGDASRPTTSWPFITMNRRAAPRSPSVASPSDNYLRRDERPQRKD